MVAHLRFRIAGVTLASLAAACSAAAGAAAHPAPSSMPPEANEVSDADAVPELDEASGADEASEAASPSKRLCPFGPRTCVYRAIDEAGLGLTITREYDDRGRLTLYRSDNSTATTRSTTEKRTSYDRLDGLLRRETTRGANQTSKLVDIGRVSQQSGGQIVEDWWSVGVHSRRTVYHVAEGGLVERFDVTEPDDVASGADFSVRCIRDDTGRVTAIEEENARGPQGVHTTIVEYDGEGRLARAGKVRLAYEGEWANVTIDPPHDAEYSITASCAEILELRECARTFAVPTVGRRIQVRVDGTEVAGELSRYVAERWLSRRAFGLCFRGRSPEAPDPAGVIRSHFTIGTSGEVELPEIVSTTIDDEGVERCLLETLASSRFVAIASPIVVTFSLRVTSGEPRPPRGYGR